jgi:hypothetical protein
MELSILCGSEVSVVIYDESNDFGGYTSTDVQKMNFRIRQLADKQRMLTNNDVRRTPQANSSCMLLIKGSRSMTISLETAGLVSWTKTETPSKKWMTPNSDSEIQRMSYLMMLSFYPTNALFGQYERNPVWRKDSGELCPSYRPSRGTNLCFKCSSSR